MLVPLGGRVRVAEFGRRLELALLRFGSTLYLDSPVVHARREASRSDLAQASERHLDRLLDEAEHARRFVICEADAQCTGWTRKCVAHADRILFVADATQSPALSEIEEALTAATPGASLMQKELVLLHASRRVPPSGTAAWLAPRIGYRHSHVAWEGNRDFHRLARLLSGNAVTLVLGGGGARGLAQIGVIRAIREAGVPIDAVGGTSVGAIIGALVALDWGTRTSCSRASTHSSMIGRSTTSRCPCSRFCRERSSRARSIITSATSTSRTCGSRTSACRATCPKVSVHVHHSGRLWEAMQASAALPGMLPPWVSKGQLHVDGGVLDNLPVGVMKRFIGGNTIAVEATVKVEYSIDADEFPSPLAYLRSRLSRRGQHALPTLPSLLIKSTLLGGAGGRNELREGDDLYINPPMREFGFLDWHRIYTMVDVGYRHGQQCVRAWIDSHPEMRRRDESPGLPQEAAAR